MASKVISKVNGRSRFLARTAPFFDAVSLRLLATSLVLCCFDYGLGSWYGGLTKALEDKPQVSQNRSVRVVLRLTSRGHVGKLLFQQLGWRPLEARAAQLQLRGVHNVCNQVALKITSQGVGMTTLTTPELVMQTY